MQGMNQVVQWNSACSGPLLQSKRWTLVLIPRPSMFAHNQRLCLRALGSMKQARVSETSS